MLRRMVVILFLTLMALVFTSCALYQPARLRLENMPQKYQQFDLVLGWDARGVGNQTVIEGVVKNVRYGHMYDLEIWVYVLDADGKVASHAMTFVIPSQLTMDETTEFEIKVPMEVAPGTKLRFTYKYKSDDGGGSDDNFFGIGTIRGFDWMQSFDAVMPARSAVPPSPQH